MSAFLRSCIEYHSAGLTLDILLQDWVDNIDRSVFGGIFSCSIAVATLLVLVRHLRESLPGGVGRKEGLVTRGGMYA